jgi:hypothetical protein
MRLDDPADKAPSATGEEYLAVCVIGLGRFAAAGDLLHADGLGLASRSSEEKTGASVTPGRA